MIRWSLGTRLKCHIAAIGEKSRQVCPHQSVAIKLRAIFAGDQISRDRLQNHENVAGSQVKSLITKQFLTLNDITANKSLPGCNQQTGGLNKEVQGFPTPPSPTTLSRIIRVRQKSHRLFSLGNVEYFCRRSTTTHESSRKQTQECGDVAPQGRKTSWLP